MLAILSGILGFATSGLPSILGFFQQRGDQKHERDMAKLQNEQQMAMAQVVQDTHLEQLKNSNCKK